MVTDRLFRALILLSLLCGLTAASAADLPERAQRVTLRGVLDVVQEDDFETNRTKRVHRLIESSTGKAFTLRFERMPATKLLTGSQVVVRGLAQGNEVFLDAGDDSGVAVEASTAAAVSGARTSLVMILDYQDATVSCSDATVADLMYTGEQSVDGLYQAASFGQLSFPGDTDGDGNPDVFRLTIDKPIGTACDAYGWAADAEAAAPAAGIDLGLYQHRIFVLPSSAPCGWAGLGNVGCGSYCRAWVKNCNLQDIYAHEEGHNLNMAHASTDTNNDGTVDCEYCDRSDIMGYAGVGWRIFNGAHEEQMGWMPPSQIVEVSASGTSTHVLSPLQQDPALAPFPQVLKIQKQDTGDYYYLTYRQRQGYDATLSTNYADRTNIHRYVGSGYNNTKFIQALQDSEQFTDGVNGLSVTQVSHDATSVTVQITTTCTASAAGVSLSPSSQAALPGGQLAYDVTVTNNDAALCDPSSFDLSAALPGGFSGSVSPSSVTLQPGQQGQATLTSTSSLSSADGDYELRVDAVDLADSGHDASGTANYVVDGTAPDAVTDLAASVKRKTQVQLQWSAAWDGGSGVASYDVFRDGAFLGSTTGTSYVDSATSSGQTYGYHVTAWDAVGNESGTSNTAEITVGSSKGGGKGGGGGGGGDETTEVCDDGIDNDGDGAIDCADKNCRRFCR